MFIHDPSQQASASGGAHRRTSAELSIGREPVAPAGDAADRLFGPFMHMSLPREEGGHGDGAGRARHVGRGSSGNGAADGSSSHPPRVTPPPADGPSRDHSELVARPPASSDDDLVRNLGTVFPHVDRSYAKVLRSSSARLDSWWSRAKAWLIGLTRW